MANQQQAPAGYGDGGEQAQCVPDRAQEQRVAFALQAPTNAEVARFGSQTAREEPVRFPAIGCEATSSNQQPPPPGPRVPMSAREASNSFHTARIGKHGAPWRHISLTYAHYGQPITFINGGMTADHTMQDYRDGRYGSLRNIQNVQGPQGSFFRSVQPSRQGPRRGSTPTHEYRYYDDVDMCYDADERGRYGSLTSIETTKGHYGNWVNFITAMPPLLMGLDGQYESRGNRESRRRHSKRQREMEAAENATAAEIAARRPKSTLPRVSDARSARPKSPNFNNDFEIHPELLEGGGGNELKSMPGMPVKPAMENKDESFLPNIKPHPDANEFLFEDLEYFTPRTAGYAKLHNPSLRLKSGKPYYGGKKLAVDTPAYDRARVGFRYWHEDKKYNMSPQRPSISGKMLAKGIGC